MWDGGQCQGPIEFETFSLNANHKFKASYVYKNVLMLTHAQMNKTVIGVISF